MIVGDPLLPGDSESIQAVAETERRKGSPLHARLSVFWGSPGTLRGEREGGRFPPLDRLDLIENGRLLTGSDDARHGLPRPSNSELLVSGAPALSTSSDGETAVIDRNLVRLHQPNGRDIVLRGHSRRVTSTRFSQDGALVVTASRDSTARIWDARTGTPLRVLRGHFGIVSDASFSPDSRWVVTAGPKTAALWQRDSGELVFYLRGHTGIVTSASFDRTGARIVTASADGTVQTYDCTICRSGPALIAAAQQRLNQTGRTLTKPERARFLS